MANISTIIDSARSRIVNLETAFAALACSRALAEISAEVEERLSGRQRGEAPAHRISRICSKAQLAAIFPDCLTLNRKANRWDYDIPALRRRLNAVRDARADAAPVRTDAFMSQLPYCDAAYHGPAKQAGAPKKRADADEKGDCAALRDLPSLCTYELLGWAEMVGTVQLDDNGASHRDPNYSARLVETTVHALAHGKMGRNGEEMFAITFRAERWVDGTRQVPWINPSNIDAATVAECVSRLAESCGVDPSRLTFFVDSSIYYRCETVEVGGFKVRTAAATETLAMREDKFAPTDSATGRQLMSERGELLDGDW